MNECKRRHWPFATHPNGRTDYCGRCIVNAPMPEAPAPSPEDSPEVQGAIRAICNAATGHDDA